MPRRASDPTHLAFDLAALWFETGWTIALRTAQMWAGTVSPGEWARMAGEKPKAFTEAALDASGAWTRSMTRPARRNRRRLARKKLRK
jgi:hypothetical protein